MMILTALAIVSANPAAKCHSDPKRMIALTEDQFDQDMEGGWRALAQHECYKAAAQLIHLYHNQHSTGDSILYWHEGQMRANAGHYKKAAKLFDLSRKNGKDAWGWNYYVDGSIAFLKNDRLGLGVARAQLMALPRPKDFNEDMISDGQTFHFPWPVNLPILDNLIRCFGRPYRDAYVCPNG